MYHMGYQPAKSGVCISSKSVKTVDCLFQLKRSIPADLSLSLSLSIVKEYIFFFFFFKWIITGVNLLV